MEENKEQAKFSQIEIARILGEPKDPRKPYTLLQNSICQVDSADPEEYVYYFDVLLDTDKIYVITASGELTMENVTPDQPTVLSFIDIASPEYYIKLTDLAKKKENILARKTITINRAMNAWENYKIIEAVEGSVQTANEFTLGSGKTHFDFTHLIAMMNSVIDYGDKFILVCGTTIAQDIQLWNWNDNKYQSLSEALKQLNVEIIRVNQTVTIDGGSTAVLAATKAYLVATDTEVGKPVLFVRKKLDSIAVLGGILDKAGDAPERLIFASPNPITTPGSSGSRYLAIGVTGYEEVVLAVINPYALASFSRE